MSFGSRRHTIAPASQGSRQLRESRRARTQSADIGNSTAIGQISPHATEGVSLDPHVRAEMEARFGESFEDVRVHNDADAHAASEQLGAKAFTIRETIGFGADRYAPHSAEGKRLLAHELAHVVQQRRGGASPDVNRDALETDATEAASQAAHATGSVAVNGASAPGVMLEEDDDRPPRRRGARDKSADPDERSERRTQRKQGKQRTEERKRGRQAAGKDEQQIAERRAEKELRRMEHDAKKQGASSRSQTSKHKNLERFQNVIKDASGTTLDKNKRTGNFDETQRTPNRTAGEAQDKFVAGGRELPDQHLRPGQDRYAQPDYSTYRRSADGKVERLHVNLKSDQVHKQTPGQARATAKYNTDQAVRNSAHLPGEEKIIIGYAHTPSAAARDAMLAEHFREGSPIEEVRFGTRTYRRSEYKPVEAPTTKKKGTKKTQKSRSKKSGSKQSRASSKSSKSSKSGKSGKSKSSKKKSSSKSKPRGKTSKSAVASKRDASLKKRAVMKSDKSTAKPNAKKTATTTKAEPTTKPPAVDAVKPVETPKVGAEPPKTAPLEGKVAPDIVPSTPTIAGKFLSQSLKVAGGLALVSAAKDIKNDIANADYDVAAAKLALVRLSFVPQVAPLLLSGASIANYWGPRHESIQKDSFAVGEAVEGLVEDIPLVGDIPYLPRIAGASWAANTAVVESVGYTLYDMGGAVVDGAETFGGLVEDAWDSL